jgi:hypothetical protein
MSPPEKTLYWWSVHLDRFLNFCRRAGPESSAAPEGSARRVGRRRAEGVRCGFLTDRRPWVQTPPASTLRPACESPVHRHAGSAAVCSPTATNPGRFSSAAMSWPSRNTPENYPTDRSPNSHIAGCDGKWERSQSRRRLWSGTGRPLRPEPKPRQSAGGPGGRANHRPRFGIEPLPPPPCARRAPCEISGSASHSAAFALRKCFARSTRRSRRRAVSPGVKRRGPSQSGGRTEGSEE